MCISSTPIYSCTQREHLITYKEPCVRILSLVETGELVAAINTEVLQELLYRYSHISLPDKGVQLCRMILKYPLLIWPVTETDIRLAIDLFHAHYARGLKVRDAIHAATMRHNDVRHLISADRDFDMLDFLSRVDPLDFRMAGME